MANNTVIDLAREMKIPAQNYKYDICIMDDINKKLINAKKQNYK